MSLVKLTFGCGPSDRVAAIFDGRVRIEGVELASFPIGPEEAFHRAFAGQDFDLTELSASSLILTTARSEAKYFALPIFLSRLFRHSAFYIRTDRGIRSPQDLRGKLIGVPEYQMTAALWARGILSDEYGLKAEEIRWRNGGLNKAGRAERTPISLPSRFELQSIPSDRTLSDMLAAGELDGIVTARIPGCYAEGAPNVDRLFPDFRSAEEAYYRKTQMFPIMHLLAIRKSLVAAHPWLAMSVVKAFYEAKQLALAEMHEVRRAAGDAAVALGRSQAGAGGHGSGCVALWGRGESQRARRDAALFRRARTFQPAGGARGAVCAGHAAAVSRQRLSGSSLSR